MNRYFIMHLRSSALVSASEIFSSEDAQVSPRRRTFSLNMPWMACLNSVEPNAEDEAGGNYSRADSAGLLRSALRYGLTLLCIFSPPIFGEGYGSADFFTMGSAGKSVLRAMAQRNTNDPNFIAVGRVWASTQYKAVIASYRTADGAQDVNFGMAANPFIPQGKLLYDFAGAGYESMCSAVTYAYDGFIAACRSMTSSNYWDIYLIKFDNTGALVTGFGTSGIKTTGLGGSTSHALPRGIVYNQSAGTLANGGVVTIVGGKGTYPSSFNPFIASFDQNTGSQVGSTTTISGISGTAVGVTYDGGLGGAGSMARNSGMAQSGTGGYYYMASTETNSGANRNIYVDRLDNNLAVSSSPWGTALNVTTASSGSDFADVVPSGITIFNSDVVVVGGTRSTYSGTPWRCAVAALSIDSGSLDTGFGSASTITNGLNNKGFTVFSHHGADPTRDCILNGVANPWMGNYLLLSGTAYNGTNYDFLTAVIDTTGTLVTTGAGNGYTTQAGNGSADDVLNGAMHFTNINKVYAVGRSQNSGLYDGMVASEITTTLNTGDSWSATTTTNPPANGAVQSAIWNGTKMIVWATGTSSNTGGLYNAVTNTWTATTTTSPPGARANPVGIWTGSKMIVWGGSNTGGVYDPVNNSWTATTTTNPPSPLISTTAIWTGSKMIVWGGSSGAAVLNSGGLYNPVTNSWAAITTTTPPAARREHTAIWTGSRMIIYGGADNAGTTAYNTGALYDPVTNSWSAITTTNPPTSTSWHSAVWTGTKMITWGGNTGTSFTNAGGLYDPVGNSWSATTSTNAPTGKHEGHVAVWTGVKMIVWGGNTGTAYTNAGAQYDPIANSWAITTTTSPPSIVKASSGVWTGSKMIVWGGSATNVSTTNTGGIYTPVTTSSGSPSFTSLTADAWVVTTTTTPPVTRNYQSAVWTGTKMIVWGGNTGATLYNTGGLYDAVTDAWTVTTTTTSPTTRTLHTAIWTGSKMIVWGGTTGSVDNTGGLYDPVTDTWTVVTTSSPPAARDYHSAIWTGSTMIVWGGSTGSTVNSGAAYNPTTNAWSVVTTTSPPSVRQRHTAVWTGSKMIIWGGDNAGTLNTGALYNPTTDAWTVVTTTTPPTARDYHTAVWSGAQMIVWGGNTGVSYYNTGGLYNPTTDTWTVMTSTTPPTARDFHTAIWTGNKMIVWGGDNGSNLNTGGLYDPISNAWTAVTTTTPPAVRAYHSVIWTGIKMIVWGGASSNSGALYTPY